MSVGQPPPSVLRAFGVEAAAKPLASGQGTAWLAGDLVLKPDAGPVYEWLATVLVDVAPRGVRIATAVRTSDGAWICDGWSATRWVEGSDPDRSEPLAWVKIIQAGRSFHGAAAHLARPDCLDERTDWWALADRAAWGERPLRFRPEFAAVAQRLQDALKPLGEPQIVHGDLPGNVLFATGLEPAIIDISPFWRPPEYAEGIVLADALAWHDAPASVLQLTDVSVAAVARGLLFRMATTNERVASGAAGVNVEDEARRYSLAADAIGV